MQNWLRDDAAAGRLKPKGEAEVPETIIVSDAVEDTFADLDGKSLREEQKGKYQREWKRSKEDDQTEMRKEEFEVRIAKWFGLEYTKEVHEKIQNHVRHLPWNRAQIEEGGNGGTVQ